MTLSQLRYTVLAERIAGVQEMLCGVRRLPLATFEAFCADLRLVAAESNLRRALEALLDLGQHILAKGFARGSLNTKKLPGASQCRGLDRRRGCHTKKACRLPESYGAFLSRGRGQGAV